MEEINIKDFFSYLKRYIWVYIIFAVLAVGGVLIYDNMFKKPIYKAQTTVVIAKSDGMMDSAATLSDVNASQKLVSTYGEIAKSELVLSRVIDNLGLRSTVKELSKNLTVKTVDDTSILSITVADPKAQLSATIANEIANVFSEEVKTIYKVENVTQLSVAVAPSSPANNTTMRDVVVVLAGAVLVVTGFAFLRFYLDDTIKQGDDVEKIIGLPAAGYILRRGTKTRRDIGELVVARSPKAIISENIKSLRTNLQFTTVDKRVKTILVTSSNASEGKSFVTANLAVSFAQADKKVLLVDCDLRRGRDHKIFGVPNTGGLSDLLAGDLRDFRKYIRRTKIEKLDVITCGTYPPNPSELLASKKNKQLIRVLRGYYDIVLFDGAPVGGLADSVILSSLVDQTLIVVRDGSTSKSELLATKEALDRVGANVAGIVFNMVNRKASKYYNYYYYGDVKKQ